MDKKVCPKCGSTEIGQGKQYGQGRMCPINSIFMVNGSEIMADICTNCGYILETRVINPDKFKKD